MLTVQSILQRKGAKVVTIEADATVLDAARRMNDHRIGALVVTTGTRVVGMFTERDILTRVVALDLPAATTGVREVMTTPVVAVKRDSPLDDCRTLMTHRRIRHLPVIENDQLLGLLSTGDILADHVARQDSTIEYLHEYIHGPHIGLSA